ncbi:nascent polypeptide-associated complex subunit alpha, muscle-specific form-like [Corvus moneduloides]|uniref:nascent polypeptide-associated complex subunit alpha, muscle-specific form-like n=1 Tax=Corvus moneduloides TaxID=1196302 RepID=UPI0013626C09|nr:nascent polypeptide-associated complex subunit alpha, muscle-specific form-like [Corvus moneduloides]
MVGRGGNREILVEEKKEKEEQVNDTETAAGEVATGSTWQRATVTSGVAGTGKSQEREVGRSKGKPGLFPELPQALEPLGCSRGSIRTPPPRGAPSQNHLNPLARRGLCSGTPEHPTPRRSPHQDHPAPVPPGRALLTGSLLSPLPGGGGPQQDLQTPSPWWGAPHRDHRDPFAQRKDFTPGPLGPLTAEGGAAPRPPGPPDPLSLGRGLCTGTPGPPSPGKGSALGPADPLTAEGGSAAGPPSCPVPSPPLSPAPRRLRGRRCVRAGRSHLRYLFPAPPGQVHGPGPPRS